MDNFIYSYMDKARETLREQFNKAIDDRFVEILHRWGKKHNISELSLIEATDEPDKIEAVIADYNIYKVETRTDGLGLITYVYSDVLNEHAIVCRYDGGAFYLFNDEEEKDA
jgi:hypothetical protein